MSNTPLRTLIRTKRFMYASALLVLIASLAALTNQGRGADSCRSAPAGAGSTSRDVEHLLRRLPQHAPEDRWTRFRRPGPSSRGG